MKNYQAEVCYYEPRPKAEVDNDKLRLGNSSNRVQPHSMMVNSTINNKNDGVL